MPVLFITPDADNSALAVVHGTCLSCNDGTEDNPIVLYAADADGIPPWVCSDCFASRHGSGPDYENVLHVGEIDNLLANYEYSLYSDRAAALNDLAPTTGMENDMPTSDLGSLRADRVVETYDFGNDYQPNQPRLLLPALSDREPRMVSVEQEIGKGREYIADQFFAGGFSTDPYTRGYHSGDDSGFCHVEEDASVNGEIVYGKLRLSDAAVAQRFEEALCLVRNSISDGEVKLDMRCGLHVHVDARGLNMDAITNLYNLWNHVEDTVFRLASANWRCHRTAVASHNYAPPTMKGLDTRAAIGSYFEGERGALNLANYLASRSRCRCGAFAYASWEDCTCDLPKSTVEFRVFNATANLRKVHAYTALSLAMVEASRRLRFNADDFPAFQFDRRNEAVTDVEATKRALSVIFEGMLPLTPTEKEDLAYCARNSSLADTYAEVYG